MEMAAILPALTSLSFKDKSDEAYDREIRDFITYIKQFLINKNSSIISDGDRILDALDPSIHSLSYLFILRLRFLAIQNSSNETLPNVLHPGGCIWSRAALFLNDFDPVQIRYAGHEWRQLVELVIQSAEAASKPLLAVPLVRNAMLRLDPSCVTFTSTHLAFVKLCLHAKAYTHALPIIDRYICHFPINYEHLQSKFRRPLCAEHGPSSAFITDDSELSAKLTYKDHLQYFLYGGMLYMALRKWRKALHFLSMVVCSPVVNSVSMVMVEAYKKWILVGLLEHKKSIALPNVVTAQTAKIYRSLARPYIALATSFDEDNYERLKTEIDVGRSIWQTDNNTGLVFQVMEKFRSAVILRLGRSFAALTVSDVAAHVSLSSISTKEMESFLASLITFGAMNATLFHSWDKSSKTTLRFLMKTSGLSAAQEFRARRRLLREAHLLRFLVDNIMQSNHVLELSSEHIEDLRKTQRRVENGAKGNSDMPIGGEVSEFDFDEDMMGDLH